MAARITLVPRPTNAPAPVAVPDVVVAACVIGLPDDYRGQTPKAFVQLKPGASLTVEALRDFLRDKISRIEMPTAIEFREELPKTAVGKLSKKELIAEARQGLSNGG